MQTQHNIFGTGLFLTHSSSWISQLSSQLRDKRDRLPVTPVQPHQRYNLDAQTEVRVRSGLKLACVLKRLKYKVRALYKNLLRLNKLQSETIKFHFYIFAVIPLTKQLLHIYSLDSYWFCLGFRISIGRKPYGACKLSMTEHKRSVPLLISTCASLSETFCVSSCQEK